MIALSFNDLAQLLNVETTATNPVLESIVTDSRKARQGSLFAALPGERVDGHDFADTAVRLGAVALLVSRPLDLPVPQLVVASYGIGSTTAAARSQVASVPGSSVSASTGSPARTTSTLSCGCSVPSAEPSLLQIC